MVLVGYAFDFALYSALVWAGQTIAIANLIAFCSGASVNALLVRKLVFDNNRFSAKTDFALTFAANVMFFSIGTLLLVALVDKLYVNPYFAKLISNVATFAGNFALRALYFRKN